MYKEICLDFKDDLLYHSEGYIAPSACQCSRQFVAKSKPATFFLNFRSCYFKPLVQGEG